MNFVLPVARPRSRPRSFVEAVCSIQPFYVLLAGLVPGFALIFGSIILHLDTLKASAPHFAATTREVGYLSALNWSISYALLLPALLYLMTNTITNLAKAMNRLHACNMVRTPNLEPAPTASLTEDWFVGTRTRKWLMIVLAVIVPAVFGLSEWFLNNFLRLIQKPTNLAFSDYDWGLAGIMQPNGQAWPIGHRLANALFDLAAFSAEILLLCSLLAFFIGVLDLGRVVPSGQFNERFVLLPDFKSNDPRLGFEVFEYPLENLLGAALVAYLICYLVRLQGAYMANVTASSLADFVNTDIVQGITQAGNDHASRSVLASVFINLFNLGDQQVRGMLAWLMSVFLAIFSMAAVVMTVRAAAQSAKLNAAEALGNNALTLSPDTRKRLDAMVVWPLGYLKLDFLVIWIIAAVGTLLLYRVGLFVAGIVAFMLFYRLVLRLLRPGN
jgi:hypothetical protein